MISNSFCTIQRYNYHLLSGHGPAPALVRGLAHTASRTRGRGHRRGRGHGHALARGHETTAGGHAARKSLYTF